VRHEWKVDDLCGAGFAAHHEIDLCAGGIDGGAETARRDNADGLSVFVNLGALASRRAF
jgi:hypothetical protein